MSARLTPFVYGEQWEGQAGRSLGFRLLEPTAPQAWTREVEGLARWLQSTPYPDHWPATDLFCSVLLEGGFRLAALVRYGIEDHAPTPRRGGIEMAGVVTAAALDAPTALRVYRWLVQKRKDADDVRELAAVPPLGQILDEAPQELATPPLPVLPIRRWQEGCFVFAAPTPTAPDQHLGLLELQSGADWQWLPLCASDFPYRTYAARGPLVAWTPDLVDVALHLDRPTGAAVTRPGPRRNGPAVLLAVTLLALLAGNWWALWTLPGRLGPATPAPREPAPGITASGAGPAQGPEAFARALLNVLRAEGGGPPAAAEAALLARYEQLAARDEALRVNDPKSQALVGLVSLLARRDAEQVAELVRQSVSAREGYDPRLIELISERVRERLNAETAGTAPPP